MTEPISRRLKQVRLTASDHRPKNNHNRMIIGIGTPTATTKFPRPIVSSSILVREGNAERKGLFRYWFGNRGQRKLDLDKRVAVSVDGLALLRRWTSPASRLRVSFLCWCRMETARSLSPPPGR